jgi:hypothetical protein
MTKKHIIEIAFFVLVGVIVLGGGLGMILKKDVSEVVINNSVSSEVKSEVKSETKTEQEVVIQNDEFADWKTYTNEQYGFKIKYPAGYAAKYFTNGELVINKIGKEGAGSVSIGITPTNSLAFETGWGSNYYYDVMKNQWIMEEPLKSSSKIMCPFMLNDNNNMPAVKYGPTGDGGCRWRTTYLITDKNYAVVLWFMSCGGFKEIENVFAKIEKTFELLPSTKTITPVCK